MSLEELKEIFYDALDAYRDNSEAFVPCEHPIDLHNRLRLYCMDRWEPLLEFQVALLLKVTRMYNDTAIVCSTELVDILK
jgi:hypothetical protein